MISLDTTEQDDRAVRKLNTELALLTEAVYQGTMKAFGMMALWSLLAAGLGYALIWIF